MLHPLLQGKKQQHNTTGSESTCQKLQGIWEQLYDIDDHSSQAFTDLVAEFETLARLASGEEFNFVHLAGALTWLESHQDMFTSEKLAAGIQNANDEISAYEQSMNSANQTQESFLQNLADGVLLGAISIEDAERILTEAHAGQENAAEEAANALEQVQAKIDAAKAAEEGFGDGVEEGSGNISTAISGVLTEIGALTDAYNEAYEASLTSIQGQFDLFESLKTIDMAAAAKEGTDDLVKSLDSQVAYLDQYAANMEEASRRGVNEGLLAQLSDGSAESAQYLAQIAQASDEEIAKLNESFASVSTAQENFASTMANMETSFDTKMQAMQEKLVETVSEMDKTSEAAAAGANTVQAFIDAAAGAQDRVTAAYGALAAAAAAALGVNITGGDGSVPKYASGTDSAAPGFALVGEEGPELMYFNGGERVLNAAETAALANSATPMPLEAQPFQSGGDVHIDLSPQYNITGTSNAAELESILTQQNDALRETIEEALRDINQDAKRRAYS